MNTLTNTNRWFRALLAAFGVAVALTSFAPVSQAQRGRHATTTAPSAAATDGVVNIQTASVEQLQLLPGIGPSKAEAIVAQRDRRAFRRVEDIMRVRGIGRTTFRRLRSMLTIDGATTLAAPQPQRRAAAE